MSCDPRSFGRCRQGRGWACDQSVIKITIIVAPWPLTFWDSVLLLARWRTKVGGRGRNRTFSDAVLETAALPVSYTPNIWHRLPVTIQPLCGHNAALCH